MSESGYPGDTRELLIWIGLLLEEIVKSMQTTTTPRPGPPRPPLPPQVP